MRTVNNEYERSFPKWTSIFLNKKAILKLLLFVLIFAATYFIAKLALVNTNSSTRLTFHQFYEQDRIDLAVIGPSRVYNGFNPMIADEELNMNTFNMGTASQTFDGSYYCLKELLKHYQPEVVYFDVEFDFLTRETGAQKCTWIISDYLRGLNKYKFIADVVDKEDLPIVLSTIYRNKPDFSVTFFLNNLKAKLNPDYWNYGTRNDVYTNYRAYIGKGMASIYKDPPEYDYFAYREDYNEFDRVSPDQYNYDTIEYLYKSIELCKEKNVEIVLFTMPESDFYIRHAGEYGQFTDFMESISREYAVDYYDFNLLVSDSFQNAEFGNLDHLNVIGASHFTKLLCDLHKDPKKLEFAQSLEDKVQAGVIGVTYSEGPCENNYKHLKWNIESFDDVQYLSQLIIEVEDTVVYESEITSSSELSYPAFDNSSVYIRIYDEAGDYIGKAGLKS